MILSYLHALFHGSDPVVIPDDKHPVEVEFLLPNSGGGYRSVPEKINIKGFQSAYLAASRKTLTEIVQDRDASGTENYLMRVASNEMQLRFQGVLQQGQNPTMTWAEYPALVQEIGRFIPEPSVERST